jgi:type 1 glutamine amidotransferase
MNTVIRGSLRNLLLSLVLTASLMLGAAEPKKVLVVTVTKGFRHSSIPTAEKIIAKLASESGAFTVDYARVEPNSPEFKGADGKVDEAKYKAAIEAALAEKLSPAALQKLDGVIFANTTGDLPLPDKEAFLAWLKSGKSFVGMHSCTDTYHGYPAFIEMLGGEFQGHGAQVGVECLIKDRKHPSTKHFGPSFIVPLEEIYLLKNYSPANVHDLLSLDKHPNDKTPGHFPIAWCRNYGEGKVFYTSLGHREDIWDAETPAGFDRKNSREVSIAFQKHILGGIKWSLGLEPGDATPGK